MKWLDRSLLVAGAMLGTQGLAGNIFKDFFAG